MVVAGFSLRLIACGCLSGSQADFSLAYKRTPVRSSQPKGCGYPGKTQNAR
jgi:hypothetical protein